MTEHQNPTSGDDEIELLLPWLSTGKLTDAERGRVDAALEQDAELTRRFALVREEFDETIRLNEALGAPSRRVAEQLFARIDAEAGKPASARAMSLLRRLREDSSRFFVVPRSWVAAAAALAIVAQAGLLAALVLRPPAGTTGGAGPYTTASAPEAATLPGRFAVVGFAPTASAADITGLLQRNHVVITDGPKGGLFTVRVGNRTLSAVDVDQVLSKLRETPNLVIFAAPKE